jgi:hypothetical protein
MQPTNMTPPRGKPCQWNEFSSIAHGYFSAVLAILSTQAEECDYEQLAVLFSFLSWTFEEEPTIADGQCFKWYQFHLNLWGKSGCPFIVTIRFSKNMRGLWTVDAVRAFSPNLCAECFVNVRLSEGQFVTRDLVPHADITRFNHYIRSLKPVSWNTIVVVC